jgi:hypothetical protein
MAAHQVTSHTFEGMMCKIYRKRDVTDPREDVYIDDSLLCVGGTNSTEEDIKPPGGMVGYLSDVVSFSA